MSRADAPNNTDQVIIRTVSPPQDQLHKLRQPLTQGEKLVFEFLNENVPPHWEIYVQPHLNGLRPDFVLLNPDVGIAVFEVKDWNLSGLDRWFALRPGRSPELMGRRNGETFSLQRENPVDQVLQYKEEIEELYCPRLRKRAGYVVITAGIIFPHADETDLQMLFQPARAFHGMLDNPRYFPLAGKDSLTSGDLMQVFPEALRQTSKHMTPGLADDLRRWLVEPDVAATQRRPLELDANQKQLVTTRTESGYRRIKGPAGSGKSLVLAARAAQLIAEGKKVLVVTYNITLLHYLMDMAVRWPHGNGNTRRDVTWLNFHSWCKRVCQEAGRRDDYSELWQGIGDDGERSESILSRDLPRLVSSILDGDGSEAVTLYDAVLVDEGQDFLPLWWEVLRKACRKGGEMLLVADVTQDTYRRAVAWPAGAWTDQAMIGAGFRGPWRTLELSYRMPPDLIDLSRRFAERYFPEHLRDLPSPPQLELNLYPCRLRWVQTDRGRWLDVCLSEILELARTAAGDGLAIADITFLVPWLKHGRDLVAALNDDGINVVHTFARDQKERRKQKVAFYMGDARVKGTTLHSFKGWETRALVIYTERARTPRELSLFYCGLTRLKRHERMSFLTVVCAEPQLESFGKQWPERKVR